MNEVVLFGAKKGGVGKSTLAVQTAALRLEKEPRKRLLLIDTDSQGSTATWARDRQNSTDKPIDCIQCLGEDIFDNVEYALNEYDNIIIDSGGRDTTELRISMLLADLMVVPLKAGGWDLDTLQDVNNLIGKAKQKSNVDLKSFAVINDYTNHYQITRDRGAIDNVSRFKHLNAVEHVIHSRVSFQRSVEKGLGVNELRNDKGRLVDPKAIKEITKLYEVIYNE
jgi:chromosome partitioning protein